MVQETGPVGSLGSAFETSNPVLQIVIWNAVYQLVSVILEPYIQVLRNEVQHTNPQVPLTPADLADMVVRGILSADKAIGEASKSGIGEGDFGLLVEDTGEVPAPGDLAAALRRGLIPEDSPDPNVPSFLGGIRRGRLRNEWADTVRKLALQPPSPADILAALLKGQTDADTAKRLYEVFGGDPTYFQVMFDTAGEGPSPSEAGDIANRGFIPWEGKGADSVSFEQAFYESQYRNKWLPVFRKLAEYLPPPRTVTAMLREGSLTEDQAKALFEQSGLTPDLAAAYVKSASNQKLAGTKDLAQGTVQTLYDDRLISRSDAAGLLGALGYSADDANLILSVEDVRREQAQLTSAITRIRTLYVDHKIDATAVTNALNSLEVPSDQVSNILQTWRLERGANVALPTPTQIMGAFHYQIISQDEAISELEGRGYAPYDAWLILSEHEHKALPGKPAANPAPL